jgi:Excalibur calcium-binding domain
VRRLDRVQWEKGLRWVRARPWPVWATAGAVFVLFAVLGAATRGPATAPAAVHSLADGIERAAGTPATATASATSPGQPRYPGVAYPTGPAATAGTPIPTGTAPSYANCAAASAAGVAPIPRGRPGYRPDLDRDGDGIACDAEDPPSSSPTTPRPTPTTTPSTTPSPSADPTPTPTDTPSPTPEPSATTDPGTTG